MNSKLIIGAIVGAIIFFIWQFLSWSILNVHAPHQKHNAKQVEIMEFLKNNIGEDGTYFLPMPPPTATMEEQQKAHQDAIGKPWAKISYHSVFEMNMVGNMSRGLFVDLLILLLTMWVIGKFQYNNFTTTLLSCLAIGFVCYLSKTYTESIWFRSNTLPDLIDAIAGWGIVGLWLGFWMNRK